MKKILFLIMLLASSLLAEDILKTDDISEGMKGYGYTVMRGERVEKFFVEVVSVLKKYRSGTDAIIVRVSGLAVEKTGVIAGMSGSPIYINDKLVGALSFAWNWSTDTLAGVTPIETMFELYEKDDSSFKTGFLPVIPENKKTDERNESEKSYKKTYTPLFFSGFDERAIESYSDTFKKYGFIPLSGGAASSEETTEVTSLKGGDACYVAFVSGDISIGGVGTVTHSDGDRFLLFGHGMDTKGILKAPVYKASIETIVPLQSLSFKIGIPKYAPVGYTLYDGKFGISGVKGDVKDLMVDISLKVSRDNSEKTFNFSIINESAYFTDLLSASVFSAIAGADGLNEEVTVNISSAIYTEYFDKPLVITNRYLSYTSAQAFQSAVNSIVYPIGVFLYNRYKRVKPVKIEINLSLSSKLNYAFIEEIRLDKNTYKPGEEVPVQVGFRRAYGDREYKTIKLQIPKTTKEGSYGIFVGNRYTFESFQQTYFPEKYETHNIEDLYNLLSEPFEPESMIVWLYVSTKGFVIRGNNYERLPSSYHGIFESEPTTDKGVLYSLIKEEEKISSTVLGSDNIQIQIKEER